MLNAILKRRWPATRHCSEAAELEYFRVFRCRIRGWDERETMKASKFSDAQKTFTLKHASWLMRCAIAASQPDLIVPCDDRVVAHLHRLYDEASAVR